MKSHKKSYLKLAVALCAILVLAIGAYFGMQAIEKAIVDKADAEIMSGLPQDKYGRVTYKDKKYKPKSRLTTTLIIGLDEFGEVEEDSNSSKNIKMADFLTLFVFDEVEKNCKVIHINRDTMMNVPVLGVFGDKAGTAYKQIAWAHTYGSGLDDSCRNTADAVSSLLYDITIDNYISLTMDAVSILNDKVGGVEVDVKDDLTALDGNLVPGTTVKLTGSQALTFVRARLGVGDSSNLSRMERQKEYMSSFVDSLTAAYNADNSFVLDATEAVGDFMVTDCTAGELAELASNVSTYTIGEIVSPKGTSTAGEEYMEHFVDEDALMDLVIETFYTEVK